MGMRGVFGRCGDPSSCSIEEEDGPNGAAASSPMAPENGFPIFKMVEKT